MDPSALASLAASLLRAGLPSLSTVVGAVVPPPWNILSGLALSGIRLALGVASDTTPDVVAQHVDADPAAAKAHLQSVEDAHADAAAEVQAYLADVQNARAMNVQVVQSGSATQWVIVGLVTLTAIGFNGVAGYLVYAGDMQTKFAVFTAMIGIYSAVIQFYFGSSKSSAESSAEVRSMLRQTIAATVPVRRQGH